MLAIAGGKGGVGKTTTALGLAAALPGQPVVVDADRDMPDLHALAGVSREPGLDAVLETDDQPSTAPVAAAPCGESSDSLSPPIDTQLGLGCPNHDCRVIPAPDDHAQRTDRLLNRLGAQFSTEADTDPPILVDTPAGVSVNAAAPLQAVDGVVLVSTACAPALRDTAKTASMARAVGTPVVGAVMTRAVARPPGAGELLDSPVLGCVPDVTGRPLENTRVTERYHAIAARIEDEMSVVLV